MGGRSGGSGWLFGGAVKQSLRLEWDDEGTETDRAICAQESLEVAGVLTTGRGAGMG